MNKILEKEISFYVCKEEQGSGFKLPFHCVLAFIVDPELCEDGLTAKISDIRNYIAMGKNDNPAAAKEARDLKGQLPCFLFAGVFKNKTRNGLVTPSNLVIADIDDISWEEYQELTPKLKEDKYILFFFVSPSGSGLKIGFNVTFTDASSYDAAATTVSGYLKNNYDVDVDPSTLNVNRLCFLSYDPEIYVNENAEKLPVSEEAAAYAVILQKDREEALAHPYECPDNIDEIRADPQIKANFRYDMNRWLHRVATSKYPGRHAMLYNSAARLGNYSWYFPEDAYTPIKEKFIEVYLRNTNGPAKNRREAERTFEDGFKFGSHPSRHRSLSWTVNAKVKGDN